MKRHKYLLVFTILIFFFNLDNVKAEWIEPTTEIIGEYSSVKAVLTSAKYADKFNSMGVGIGALNNYSQNNQIKEIIKVFDNGEELYDITNENYARKVQYMYRTKFLIYNGNIAFSRNTFTQNRSSYTGSFLNGTDMTGGKAIYGSRFYYGSEVRNRIAIIKGAIDSAWSKCSSLGICSEQKLNEKLGKVTKDYISNRDLRVEKRTKGNFNYYTATLYNSKLGGQAGGKVYSTDYSYPMGYWYDGPFYLGPYYYTKDPEWNRSGSKANCRYTKDGLKDSGFEPAPCSKVVGHIIAVAGNTIENDTNLKHLLNRDSEIIINVVTQSAIFEYLKGYSICGQGYMKPRNTNPAVGCGITWNNYGSNDVIPKLNRWFGYDLYGVSNTEWNFDSYYKNITSLVAPNYVQYCVQNVLDAAFRSYQKYVDRTKKNSSDYITVNMEGNKDKNLYFDASNSYVSNKVIVQRKDTVDRGVSVKVKFSVSGVSSKTTSLCFENENNCSSFGENNAIEKTLIGSSNRLVVYLKVPESNVNKVNLNINASVEGNIDEVRDYDTYRYHADNSSGLVGYIAGTGEIVSGGSQDKFIEFTPKVVTHKNCENEGGLKGIFGDNVKIKQKGNGGACFTKVCAGSGVEASGSDKINVDDYSAEFGACNVETVDLGDGKKVRIRLYENAQFVFGPLDKDKISSGQGFGLQQGEGNVLKTLYESTISWSPVDYLDGKAYYYNENNKSNNKMTGDMNKAVSGSIIEKRIKKDNGKVVLKLPIEATDSNDGKKEFKLAFKTDLSCSMIDVSPYNQIKCTVSDEEQMKKGLKLPQACITLDANGTVIYNEDNAPCDDEKFVDGENQYYVPLDFSEKGFSFNIVNADLSVLENDFNYCGKCITIPPPGGDPFRRFVRYRSIDLDNPFPRATVETVPTKVPINWKDWYFGDTSSSGNNKARLSDSYTKDPIYIAHINQTTISKLKQSKGKYTDWNNIQENGTSKLIESEGGLFTRNNASSYCQIGEFKEVCDR